MSRMTVRRWVLAALAGAAIAGCNFITQPDEYRGYGLGGASSSSGTGAGSVGGGGATTTSSSSGTGGSTPKPGTAEWAYALGTTGADVVNAMAADSDGHVFLSREDWRPAPISSAPLSSTPASSGRGISHRGR